MMGVASSLPALERGGFAEAAAAPGPARAAAGPAVPSHVKAGMTSAP